MGGQGAAYNAPMLASAILSLALSILILLLCYGILNLTVAFGGGVGGVIRALIGFASCGALIVWGIWFIVRHWSSS
jgi:hypothetical protein